MWELFQRVTSNEVNELLDLARFPFGERRADMRAGFQSAHAARPYLKSEPDPLNYTLRFEGEDPTDEAEEIARLLGLIPGARLINATGESGDDG